MLKEGHYAQAETFSREMLSLMEQERGPDSLEAAEILDVLVEALIEGGKTTGSVTHALAIRAVTIKEKQLGPDHSDVAVSLNNLARLLQARGSYPEAKPLYERALAIREKQLGPDHPDVAETLDDLGVLFRYMGSYAEAKPLLQRALAIREKQLGPEHPDVAETLDNLAGLLRYMGSSAEAKPLCERALAIFERRLGREHPSTATVLNNLALILRSMGSYAEARPLLERALAILEKQLGPEHPYVGTGLNNLAWVLEAMGNYDEALPLYERALTIAATQRGPEHPAVALSLNNLARVLGQMGSYAEAKPLLERALAIREKQLGPEHPDVGLSLNNLARVLGQMGSYAEAKPLLERALTIREKQLGREHPDVADSLGNLATLLGYEGSYTEAKSLVERALAIQEQQLGPAHPIVAKSLGLLAKLQVMNGEQTDGLTHALRAEEIGRSHLRLTVQALAEPQALRYASVRVSTLDLLLSLAAESAGAVPESAGAVWDALLRSRALILDEMASRHREIARSDDPEIAELSSKYTLAGQRLANLYVRGPGKDPPERYRSMLSDARHDWEQAEERLAERSLSLRQERARQRIGLAEVAANLPPESALVAHAIYRTPSMPERKVEPFYLAFVLRQGDKEPAVVPLGEATVIDRLVSRWQDLVRRPSGAGGESGYRRVGEELRRKVWDPIAPHLVDAKQVFMVPEGSLNLVSFAALPMGKTQYLVENGPILHYLSSERDLVPLEGSIPGDKGLLAIGGAAFNERSLFAALAPKGKGGASKSGSVASAGPPPAGAAITVAQTGSGSYRGASSSCTDFSSKPFELLPGSLGEAGDVAALWKRHAGRKGDVLTGAAATEAAVKLQARGHQILHLATHGFFLGDCPSALEGSRGSGGLVEAREDQPPPPVNGENPLLLSGLVLAGANHRGSARPDEDDGILTAEEIGALDLSGVEWAVLSACDTGRGEIRAGEGVFGLRRAFQVAGARTLIMSLWKVNDQWTRRWMRALYAGRLEKRLSTAEAVREASREILEDQRRKHESTHPFSWAAFVAAGDWR